MRNLNIMFTESQPSNFYVFVENIKLVMKRGS